MDIIIGKVSGYIIWGYIFDKLLFINIFHFVAEKYRLRESTRDL